MVGVRVADPLAAVAPVPESATLSAVELLLTDMVQVAVIAPVVLGPKTIEAVQLAEAARLVPQFVDWTLKSLAFVPEMVRAPSVTVPVVVLLMVMD